MRMKPHRSNHHRLASLCAGPALTVTTFLHAGDPATDFSIEAGLAAGKYESPGGDADLPRLCRRCAMGIGQAVDY